MKKHHNEERQYVDDFQTTNASTSNNKRKSSGTSDKLTYLLVGSGVGALLALLFAPKSGTELRTDIADAARKGVDKGRETGTQLRQRSGEYINTAKQKAGDIYSRTGGALTAAKSEFGKKSGAENESKSSELIGGPHNAIGSAASNRDEHDDFPIA
jgi:gas vesicle protein